MRSALVAWLLTASLTARAELPVSSQTFRLANGLKVVLIEDHTVPKIAVVTRVAVGSADEEPGRTGFAHLFEHLMFKGTPAIPDGRMDRILEEGGGYSTAFTDGDETVYQEWAASSFLETTLWIEADRLTSLLDAFDEHKLANQRDVVRNERREGYDNQPYGMAPLLLAERLWPAGHGYHWATIGSHEDLIAASVDDVKSFFRRYYVPANMTMVVAGDFDPGRARELVIRLAGRIPRAPWPVRPPVTPLAPLAAPVRHVATDDVAVPRVYLAWRGPPRMAPDEPAATLATAILGGGKSSRLYERLVYRERLAQEVSADFSDGQLGGEIDVVATARPGVTPERLEAAVLDEIARLATTAPTPEEVARARNVRELGLLRRLETVEGKALRIAQYDGHTGDPDYLAKDLERFRAVQARDIQEAVAHWLPATARVNVTIVPEQKKP